ncbi:MAG: F420-nonreducing hydrogenase [bacterium]
MQIIQMGPIVSIATTWLRSCSGCHMKMFDLREEFLHLRPEGIRIDYFTVVGEKDIPSVDIGIIEGAVANKANEMMLRKFREKSKILVAVGTCACFGELSRIRRLFQEECIIEKKPSGPGDMPGEGGEYFHPQARPLNQFVAVDYYIPGCPPLLENMKEIIMNLLQGQEPKPKTTKSLCAECKRQKSASACHQDLPSVLDSFHTAIQTQKIDPTMCFLDQGVLCRGSVTVQGCGARCLKGNVPCWGCMGPALELYEDETQSLKRIIPTLHHPGKGPISIQKSPDPGRKPAGPFSPPIAAAKPSTIGGKDIFP